MFKFNVKQFTVGTAFTFYFVTLQSLTLKSALTWKYSSTAVKEKHLHNNIFEGLGYPIHVTLKSTKTRANKYLPLSHVKQEER